jgi:hypothetical protein
MDRGFSTTYEIPGELRKTRRSNASVFYLGLIYLMFFFSGAAALVYQVVWVRSFALIFGGSIWR